jgi:hypothetical protein
MTFVFINSVISMNLFRFVQFAAKPSLREKLSAPQLTCPPEFYT